MSEQAAIQDLRKEMNDRFSTLDITLGRLAESLAKLAANESRIAVLETRAAIVDRDLSHLSTRVDGLAKEERTQNVSIAKLDQVKVAGLFLAGAVCSVVARHLIDGLSWFH